MDLTRIVHLTTAAMGKDSSLCLLAAQYKYGADVDFTIGDFRDKPNGCSVRIDVTSNRAAFYWKEMSAKTSAAGDRATLTDLVVPHLLAYFAGDIPFEHQRGFAKEVPCTQASDCYLPCFDAAGAPSTTYKCGLNNMCQKTSEHRTCTKSGAEGKFMKGCRFMAGGTRTSFAGYLDMRGRQMKIQADVQAPVTGLFCPSSSYCSCEGSKPDPSCVSVPVGVKAPTAGFFLPAAPFFLDAGSFLGMQHGGIFCPSEAAQPSSALPMGMPDGYCVKGKLLHACARTTFPVTLSGLNGANEALNGAQVLLSQGKVLDDAYAGGYAPITRIGKLSVGGVGIFQLDQTAFNENRMAPLDTFASSKNDAYNGCTIALSGTNSSCSTGGGGGTAMVVKYYGKDHVVVTDTPVGVGQSCVSAPYAGRTTFTLRCALNQTAYLNKVCADNNACGAYSTPASGFHCANDCRPSCASGSQRCLPVVAPSVQRRGYVYHLAPPPAATTAAAPMAVAVEGSQWVDSGYAFVRRDTALVGRRGLPAIPGFTPMGAGSCGSAIKTFVDPNPLQSMMDVVGCARACAAHPGFVCTNFHVGSQGIAQENSCVDQACLAKTMCMLYMGCTASFSDVESEFRESFKTPGIYGAESMTEPVARGVTYRRNNPPMPANSEWVPGGFTYEKDAVVVMGAGSGSEVCYSARASTSSEKAPNSNLEAWELRPCPGAFVPPSFAQCATGELDFEIGGDYPVGCIVRETITSGQSGTGHTPSKTLYRCFISTMATSKTTTYPMFNRGMWVPLRLCPNVGGTCNNDERGLAYRVGRIQSVVGSSLIVQDTQSNTAAIFNPSKLNPGDAILIDSTFAGFAGVKNAVVKVKGMKLITAKAVFDLGCSSFNPASSQMYWSIDTETPGGGAVQWSSDGTTCLGGSDFGSLSTSFCCSDNTGNLKSDVTTRTACRNQNGVWGCPETVCELDPVLEFGGNKECKDNTDCGWLKNPTSGFLCMHREMSCPAGSYAMGLVCMLLPLAFDTPGWKNAEKGWPCSTYAEKGWCKDGAVVVPEFTGGMYLFPENNCVICGKTTPAPVSPVMKGKFCTSASATFGKLQIDIPVVPFTGGDTQDAAYLGKVAKQYDEFDKSSCVYRSYAKPALTQTLAFCPNTGSCSTTCCPGKPTITSEATCLGINLEMTATLGCPIGQAVKGTMCEVMNPGSWTCPMANCPGATGAIISPGWTGSTCTRGAASGACNANDVVTTTVHVLNHGFKTGEQVRCTGYKSSAMRNAENTSEPVYDILGSTTTAITIKDVSGPNEFTVVAAADEITFSKFGTNFQISLMPLPNNLCPLAMIKSSADQGRAFAAAGGSGTPYIYIGGRFHAAMNRWEWEDGTVVSGYYNWALGQGQLSQGSTTPYMALNTASGKWHSLTGNGVYGALCGRSERKWPAAYPAYQSLKDYFVLGQFNKAYAAAPVSKQRSMAIVAGELSPSGAQVYQYSATLGSSGGSWNGWKNAAGKDEWTKMSLRIRFLDKVPTTTVHFGCKIQGQLINDWSVSMKVNEWRSISCIAPGMPGGDGDYNLLIFDGIGNYERIQFSDHTLERFKTEAEARFVPIVAGDYRYGGVCVRYTPPVSAAAAAAGDSFAKCEGKGAECKFPDSTQDYQFRYKITIPDGVVAKTTADEDIVVLNAPGVGGWGGYCTCPNGKVYGVGDENNFCGSLACGGGTAGKCNNFDGEWSRKRVTCGQRDIPAYKCFTNGGNTMPMYSKEGCLDGQVDRACDIEVDTNWRGPNGDEDVRKDTTASSIKECSAFCTAEPLCEYYVYSSQACYLKKNKVLNKIKLAGYTSGPKCRPRSWAGAEYGEGADKLYGECQTIPTPPVVTTSSSIWTPSYSYSWNNRYLCGTPTVGGVDEWTLALTGAVCYWKTDGVKNCAVCQNGGCQCNTENAKDQCTKCGTTSAMTDCGSTKFAAAKATFVPAPPVPVTDWSVGMAGNGKWSRLFPARTAMMCSTSVLGAASLGVRFSTPDRMKEGKVNGITGWSKELEQMLDLYIECQYRPMRFRSITAGSIGFLSAANPVANMEGCVWKGTGGTFHRDNCLQPYLSKATNAQRAEYKDGKLTSAAVWWELGLASVTDSRARGTAQMDTSVSPMVAKMVYNGQGAPPVDYAKFMCLSTTAGHMNAQEERTASYVPGHCDWVDTSVVTQDLIYPCKPFRYLQTIPGTQIGTTKIMKVENIMFPEPIVQVNYLSGAPTSAIVTAHVTQFKMSRNDGITIGYRVNVKPDSSGTVPAFSGAAFVEVLLLCPQAPWSNPNFYAGSHTPDMNRLPGPCKYGGRESNDNNAMDSGFGNNLGHRCWLGHFTMWPATYAIDGAAYSTTSMNWMHQCELACYTGRSVCTSFMYNKNNQACYLFNSAAKEPASCQTFPSTNAPPCCAAGASCVAKTARVDLCGGGTAGRGCCQFKRFTYDEPPAPGGYTKAMCEQEQTWYAPPVASSATAPPAAVGTGTAAGYTAANTVGFFKPQMPGTCPYAIAGYGATVSWPFADWSVCGEATLVDKCRNFTYSACAASANSGCCCRACDEPAKTIGARSPWVCPDDKCEMTQTRQLTCSSLTGGLAVNKQVTSSQTPNELCAEECCGSNIKIQGGVFGGSGVNRDCMVDGAVVSNICQDPGAGVLWEAGKSVKKGVIVYACQGKACNSWEDALRSDWAVQQSNGAGSTGGGASRLLSDRTNSPELAHEGKHGGGQRAAHGGRRLNAMGTSRCIDDKGGAKETSCCFAATRDITSTEALASANPWTVTSPDPDAWENVGCVHDQYMASPYDNRYCLEYKSIKLTATQTIVDCFNQCTRDGAACGGVSTTGSPFGGRASLNTRFIITECKLLKSGQDWNNCPPSTGVDWTVYPKAVTDGLLAKFYIIGEGGLTAANQNARVGDIKFEKLSAKFSVIVPSSKLAAGMDLNTDSSWIPSIAQNAETGEDVSVNLLDLKQSWVVIMVGKLVVPSTGIYEFKCTASTWFRIYVAGSEVMTNQDDQEGEINSGPVTLQKSSYDFRIDWVSWGPLPGPRLVCKVKRPGTTTYGPMSGMYTPGGDGGVKDQSACDTAGCEYKCTATPATAYIAGTANSPAYLVGDLVPSCICRGGFERVTGKTCSPIYRDAPTNVFDNTAVDGFIYATIDNARLADADVGCSYPNPINMPAGWSVPTLTGVLSGSFPAQSKEADQMDVDKIVNYIAKAHKWGADAIVGMGGGYLTANAANTPTLGNPGDFKPELAVSNSDTLGAHVFQAPCALAGLAGGGASRRRRRELRELRELHTVELTAVGGQRTGAMQGQRQGRGSEQGYSALARRRLLMMAPSPSESGSESGGAIVAPSPSPTQVVANVKSKILIRKSNGGGPTTCDNFGCKWPNRKTDSTDTRTSGYCEDRDQEGMRVQPKCHCPEGYTLKADRKGCKQVLEQPVCGSKSTFSSAWCCRTGKTIKDKSQCGEGNWQCVVDSCDLKKPKTFTTSNAAAAGGEEVQFVGSLPDMFSSMGGTRRRQLTELAEAAEAAQRAAEQEARENATQHALYRYTPYTDADTQMGMHWVGSGETWQLAPVASRVASNFWGDTSPPPAAPTAPAAPGAPAASSVAVSGVAAAQQNIVSSSGSSVRGRGLGGLRRRAAATAELKGASRDFYVRFKVKSSGNVQVTLYRFAYSTEDAYSFRLGIPDKTGGGEKEMYEIRVGDKDPVAPGQICQTRSDAITWGDAMGEEDMWLRFSGGSGEAKRASLGRGTSVGLGVLVECSFGTICGDEGCVPRYLGVSTPGSSASWNGFEMGAIYRSDAVPSPPPSDWNYIVHCNLDGQFLDPSAASVNGVGLCLDCPVGRYFGAMSEQYVPTSALDQEGAVQSGGRHTSCQVCPAGLVAPAPKASACVYCEQGTFTTANAKSGATTCEDSIDVCPMRMELGYRDMDLTSCTKGSKSLMCEVVDNNRLGRSNERTRADCFGMDAAAGDTGAAYTDMYAATNTVVGGVEKRADCLSVGKAIRDKITSLDGDTATTFEVPLFWEECDLDTGIKTDLPPQVFFSPSIAGDNADSLRLVNTAVEKAGKAAGGPVAIAYPDAPDGYLATKHVTVICDAEGGTFSLGGGGGNTGAVSPQDTISATASPAVVVARLASLLGIEEECFEVVDPRVLAVCKTGEQRLELKISCPGSPYKPYRFVDFANIQVTSGKATLTGGARQVSVVETTPYSAVAHRAKIDDATFAPTCLRVGVTVASQVQQAGWVLYRPRLMNDLSTSATGGATGATGANGVDARPWLRGRSIIRGGCSFTPRDVSSKLGQSVISVECPAFVKDTHGGRKKFEYNRDTLTAGQEFTRTYCNLAPGMWKIEAYDSNGDGWGAGGKISVCESNAMGQCYTGSECGADGASPCEKVQDFKTGRSAATTMDMGRVVQCPAGHFCPSLHTKIACVGSLSQRIICVEGSRSPTYLEESQCPGPVAVAAPASAAAAGGAGGGAGGSGGGGGGGGGGGAKSEIIPCSTVQFSPETKIQEEIRQPGKKRVEVSIANLGGATATQVFDLDVQYRVVVKAVSNDDSLYWFRTEDGKQISTISGLETFTRLAKGTSVFTFQLDSNYVSLKDGDESESVLVEADLTFEWYNEGSDGPPPSGRAASHTKTIRVSLTVKVAGAMLVFPNDISEKMRTDSEKKQVVYIWNVAQTKSFNWRVEELKSKAVGALGAAPALNTSAWMQIVGATSGNAPAGSKVPNFFTVKFMSSVPSGEYLHTLRLIADVQTPGEPGTKEEATDVSLKMTVDSGPTVPVNCIVSLGGGQTSPVDIIVQASLSILVSARDRFNRSTTPTQGVYVSWQLFGGAAGDNNGFQEVQALPIIADGVASTSEYTASVRPATMGKFLVTARVGTGETAVTLPGSPFEVVSRQVVCDDKTEIASDDGTTCMCLAGLGRAVSTDPCERCPATAYKSATGNAVCTTCPPGSEGTDVGQSSLAACKCNKNKLLSMNTEGVCACKLNTYGDASAAAFVSCSNCDKGLHTAYGTDDETGLVNTSLLMRDSRRLQCVACPREKPVSDGQAGECKACPPGSQPNDDKSGCDTCKLHEYSFLDTAGQVCRKCLVNEMTVREGSSDEGDCICRAGFFKNVTSCNPTGSRARNFTSACPALCVKCPKGGFCEQGTQAPDMIRAMPSYWRVSPKSLTFHSCSVSFYYETGTVVLGQGALNLFGNCLGGRHSMCAPVWPLATIEKHFKPELNNAKVNRNFKISPLDQYPTSCSDSAAADIVEAGGENGSTSVTLTADGTPHVEAFCPGIGATSVEARAYQSKGVNGTESDANFKYQVMFYYYQVFRGNYTQGFDVFADEVLGMDLGKVGTNITSYIGVKCGQCGGGSGRRRNQCEECPAGAANIGVILIMVVVLSVVFILMVWMQIRKGYSMEKSFASAHVVTHLPLTKVQQRHNLQTMGTYSGDVADPKVRKKGK